MSKVYKHIFWDLDHTLWDFDHNSTLTLAALYREFDLSGKGIPDFDAYRIAYEKHNDYMWDLFRKGATDRATLRWKRVALTMADFNIEDDVLVQEMSERYLYLLPKQGALLPYAKEILQYCHDKGYDQYLITNGFQNTQWEKIRTSNIESYFKVMYSSENTGSMKPQMGIFDFAISDAKADLERSIIIGDSIEADIIGGINYGMDQIWYNPFELKSDLKPTFEVRTLEEITTVL